MKSIRGLILCIQFFTSIPIPYEVPMEKAYIERAVRMFPILGLMQGAVYALLLYGLMEWPPFTPLAISFIIWLLLIYMTGGIHLDGWMDASDAYFSFRSIEKRLEVMKDPRIGAFGVLSVIVLLAARFLFIYEIVLNINSFSFIGLGLIPFLSKSVMGVLLIKVKAAKEDGLGTLFKQAAKKSSIFIYIVYLAVLFAALFLMWTDAVYVTLLLVITAIIFLFIMANKIVKWFGGMTGDILGASVEGMEIILWMMLWLWHYFDMG